MPWGIGLMPVGHNAAGLLFEMLSSTEQMHACAASIEEPKIRVKDSADPLVGK